jgi:hypothetical protein
MAVENEAKDGKALEEAVACHAKSHARRHPHWFPAPRTGNLNLRCSLGLHQCRAEPRYHLGTSLRPPGDDTAAISPLYLTLDQFVFLKPVEAAGDRRLIDLKMLSQASYCLRLACVVDRQRDGELTQSEVRLVAPDLVQECTPNDVQQVVVLN